jgi:glycine/D-amino acid oxidase-like deaminating enzyme/nitrite reductase/ring-hydroxylating ferredoxin subunit
MDTTSFWHAISTRQSHYPELNEDLEVDVVIIGGGITGVTAATQLIAAGKKVALLEAKEMGGVTTGSSTGNLYVAVQPFYQSIYSKFNLETAKAIAQSRKTAIDYIEKKVQDHDIHCQFHRRPWYAYTNRDARISLDKEVELFKKMDIDVDYTTTLPLPLKFKKAVVMPNQARFNPFKYVLALTELLAKKGCHIFENTRVTSIEEKSTCTVSTDKAKIRAKKVFIATHTPIGINPTQLFTAAYRSYVVAVTLKNKDYPEGHFWDLDRPPHATCTHAISKQHPELLMVAGSHHKTGQGSNTQLHYKELTTFLTDHFQVDEIAYQWSAQHFQSADDVPYIGLAKRSGKHVYMATGYFADGLVYGTVAGIMMGDLLAGKRNALENTYQSNRITPVASASFLLKEDSNVFFEYLKDFPIVDSDYANLKNGEGKIVEINQEKCAVSRDNEGNLHIVSGVCTHMKCIVSWNGAEQSWDCPCHGSRFTQQGEVIEGPATVNLQIKNKHH